MLFFPTYASYDAEADVWSVDLHLWAFRVAAGAARRDAVSRVFRRGLGLKKEHANTQVYQRRAALFLVDVIKRQPISVRLGGEAFPLGETRKSGHMETTLQLPGGLVRSLCSATGTLWFEPHEETGLPGIAVRLITPQGVSVISDIDDTTKASYVWKKRKLLKTTFVRSWKATKGLAAVYGEWARLGAAFHYVSTTPWQLFPELDAFKRVAGYPEGTYHLKRFRVQDRSFLDLFAKAEKYKPRLIEPILLRFPHRRFVLVGDSGERDPEIYGQLARRYPEQVTAILIRDVAALGSDHTRYARAFAGLPRSSWQVFDKARHIATPQVLQPS